jgi:YidC/Oxa1 family membrane protein insertase
MYASLTTPIGKIFQPLLDAVGAVLAFFYSLIPNYPVDVAMLTIVIMALLTPLTVKSTKNMAAMQALGPEMKKLQQKYKGPENRAQLNEEMMKLYKEHKVNPASGCLPMLLQMPAFFILYSVIRGMTNTVTIPAHTKDGLKVAAQVVALPRYIPNPSKMRTDIVAAHGQLNSFGLDFSDKLLSHHSSLFVAIPYLLLVGGAVGLQYLQMSRLNARNPGASQANPQAAMLQKYMPLIFGFIYLNVAAILNVYFIISSAIRILTQEVLFRKGMVGGPPPPPTPGAKESGSNLPAADRTERALPKPKAGASGGSASKGGTRPPSSNGSNGSNGKARRPAADAPIEAQASEKRRPPTRSASGNGSANGAGNGTARKRPAPSNSTRSGGTRPGGTTSKGSSNRTNRTNGTNGTNGSKPSDSDEESSARPKEHPRSKAKRERKAR